MPTALAPVRLDAEITEAARVAAARMSRSVAQQVSHWARIGLELERARDVSAAEIRRVLDGQTGYDTLSSKEQAVVRAVWSSRVDSLRETLRLDRDFAAAGYRYAEIDEHGALVLREPAAPRAKAVVRRLRPGKKAAGK
jgi:hypothetical protein